MLFFNTPQPGEVVNEKEDIKDVEVPKNTPAKGPKAVGQAVPPRCAMQGPTRGGPPS